MATSGGSGSGRISGFVKGVAVGVVVLAGVLAVLAFMEPPEEESQTAATGERLDDEAPEDMTDDSLVGRTEPAAEAEAEPVEQGAGSAELAGQGTDGGTGESEPAEENSTDGEAMGTSGASGGSTSEDGDVAGSGGGEAGAGNEAQEARVEGDAGDEAAGEEVQTATADGAADPMGSGTADASSAPPPPLEGAGPPALEGPALEVNAAGVGDGDGRRLAVVIDGAVARDVSEDVILSLPVDVALGIVPGTEGDEALAEAARRRTFEVVAQLPVVEPGGKTPGALTLDMPPAEIAERTEKLLGRLDQAVAASLTGEVMGDQVLGAVAEALDRHGFGFLGEGSVPVPAVAPLRRAKPEATAEEVTALLNEVAAEAGEEGAVVVLPPSRAALQALADWNAGTGEDVLAPLSTVLKQASAE